MIKTIHKKLGKQDGMIFIGTLMAMLFFSAMAASMNYLTATTTAGSIDDSQATQALYVADGGMQYIQMSQLNNDMNFSDNVSPTEDPFGGTSITLGAGQFWVEYLNKTASTMTVRVTSRVGNAVKVISQNVTRANNPNEFAVMAGGNFNSNSSTGVINGNIALTGNANIDTDIVHNGTVTSSPTMTMPQLDFNLYKAMCASTYVGNLVISANYTGNLCVTGTVLIRDNVTYTGLLYATGNVTISGNNVTINGSIFSEGNFRADHNAGLSIRTSTSNPTQMMPAIASKGNLSIVGSDNMIVEGYAWTEGNLDFGNSDHYRVRGALVAGGDFNGNIIMNSTEDLSLTFDATYMTGMVGYTPGGIPSGPLTISLASWDLQ